jgi:chromosome partitioning protein
MPYVIAIANQKGGVGKTTTAVNLSACLAKSGRRVLVVDLDSQANCTHFGIDPEAQHPNAYHALTDSDSDLRSVVLNVRTNLDLVQASLDLATLDLQLAGAVNRDRRLHKQLRAIQACYEFILIDCPPSLGVATINAFAACTHLIVCIQTHMFSYSGMTVCWIPL